MDQPLHVGVGSSVLSDCSWHSDVGLLELRLLLMVDLGSDAVDNYILVSNDVAQLLLVGKVVELDIGFVAQIGSWLDFFEFVVPDSASASVRVDDRRTHSGQHRADRHSKDSRSTKDGGVDARKTVPAALVVDMEPLELVVSTLGGE